MKNIKYFITGWRKVVLEVLVIAFVFFAVRHYQHQDMSKGHAPEIHGVLINNTEINWTSYKGKPLLIHFWATWCSVCKFEEDSIESISKDYNVLTIASWSEQTQDYMKKQGLSFPTLDDVDGAWAKHYGVKAVPATFIVNPNGEIDYIETGYSSEVGLRLRLWSLGI